MSLPPVIDATLDVFDNASFGVALIDVTGGEAWRVLRSNRKLADMLGRDPEELERLGGRALVHPDDRATADRLYAQLLEQSSEPVEVRALRGDGSIMWALVDVISLAAAGTPELAVAHVVETTESKQMEAHRAAIVSSALDAIVSIDHTGVITEFNPAAERLFGYSLDQALGSPLAELIIPARLRDVHRAGLRRVAAGEPGRVIGRRLALTAVSAEGREFPVELTISRTQSDPPAFTGFIRDLSEREDAERENERLQAELEQAQRLETVGQLAGGVAHDFNNLLSVILNCAAFVERALPEGHEALADVRQITGAGERAAELTRQLLTFSRRDVPNPQELDLAVVVGELRSLLERTLGKHVELRIEGDAELPTVRIDRSRIEQVLINLAVNARDAMPDGGTLTIGLRGGRRTVRLTVADNGVGMFKRVASHAFDPFFTTKPEGSGTGLGLSTVYGIVTQAGGQIGLESEPGFGTTFTIDLPISAGSEPSEPPALRSEPPPADGQTVLVVEDEEGIRALAVRILQRHGYVVVGASDGVEALAMFQSADPPVDLVLSDVAMPRMNGVKLAERLGEIADVPVLLMSGYDDVVAGDAKPPPSVVGFTAKPFKAEDLLGDIGAALAVPSTGT